MIEVRAQLRFARLSPRKTRAVAAVIRGMKVTDAEAQLSWQRTKPGPILLKLLRSAIANADHNHKLGKTNLFIKSLQVDMGPVLKRYAPKAFGRAGSIRKPTSHITLVLASTKPAQDEKKSATDQKTAEKEKPTASKTDNQTDKKVSGKKKVIEKKSIGTGEGQVKRHKATPGGRKKSPSTKTNKPI